MFEFFSKAVPFFQLFPSRVKEVNIYCARHAQGQGTIGVQSYKNFLLVWPPLASYLLPSRSGFDFRFFVFSNQQHPQGSSSHRRDGFCPWRGIQSEQSGSEDRITYSGGGRSGSCKRRSSRRHARLRHPGGHQPPTEAGEIQHHDVWVYRQRQDSPSANYSQVTAVSLEIKVQVSSL